MSKFYKQLLEEAKINNKAIQTYNKIRKKQQQNKKLFHKEKDF